MHPSGLGLGLANLYLNEPHTRVILTARSSNDPSTILNALPQSYPGTLHGIHKLDSASTADAITLRHSLLSPETGVPKIDIIIANAGVGEPFDTLLDAPINALEQFYQVNALGPVRLYQQLWKDLLEKSSNPKFILVSSVLGSLTYVDPTPCGGYGASKAAGNYFVRKMHEENGRVVAVSIHPGYVYLFLSHLTGGI
jgi:norsolorinic acid ketoreductase